MSMMDRPRYEGEPGFVRLYRGLINVLTDRPLPRRICHECSVDYMPDLTDGHCPICGSIAASVVTTRRSRRRDLAGLGLVWLVGVIVFLLLVHALYG
jgi:hypothetical protein